jgi:hypothetical protein
MNKIKFTLAATALTAMAISFTACGGSKPTPISEVAPNNQVEVSTPRTELLDLANKEYSSHYFGIGQGTSNNEGMASEVASISARREMALQIESSISTKAKESGINTIGDESIDAYMRRTIQTADQTLSDARAQKTRVLYDQKEGKYTVYVLFTVPKDGANSAIKKQLTSEAALKEAVISKAIMDMVDKALDK